MTPLHRIAPAYWLLAIAIAFGGGFAGGAAAQRGDLKLDLPDIVAPLKPAPVKQPGLYVIIAREATDKGLTPAQISAIDSGVFADYLAAKDAKWRKFDPQNPPGDMESPVWREAWEDNFANWPKEKFPAVLVSNGKTGDVVPLPADLDGLMAFVKKYGGE